MRLYIIKIRRNSLAFSKYGNAIKNAYGKGNRVPDTKFLANLNVRPCCNSLDFIELGFYNYCCSPQLQFAIQPKQPNKCKWVIDIFVVKYLRQVLKTSLPSRNSKWTAKILLKQTKKRMLILSRNFLPTIYNLLFCPSNKGSHLINNPTCIIIVTDILCLRIVWTKIDEALLGFAD